LGFFNRCSPVEAAIGKHPFGFETSALCVLQLGKQLFLVMGVLCNVIANDQHALHFHGRLRIVALPLPR
jgi:hypothetical protein